MNRLRDEVFPYHAVSVARIGFHGCSLHPLPLAFEFRASYGEIPAEAAKEDNHPDTSPLLKSTTCQRVRTDYRTRRRRLPRAESDPILYSAI